MPRSKRHPPSPHSRAGDIYRPRPSVTLPLFRAPEDYRRFRRMLFNIFALKDRLSGTMRDLARTFDLTAPQHTILSAVADLAGRDGISVMALADYMRVSSPFIAAQTKSLSEKGLLLKEPDPNDRRHTLLRLTDAGEDYVEAVIDILQAANDLLFRSLNRDNLAVFEAVLQSLVSDAEVSDAAVQAILAKRRKARR